MNRLPALQAILNSVERTLPAEYAARFRAQRLHQNRIAIGPGYALFTMPWYRLKLVAARHLIPAGASEAYLATVQCRCGRSEIAATARLSLSSGTLGRVTIMPRDSELFRMKNCLIDRVRLHAARPSDPPFPVTGRHPLATPPPPVNQAARCLHRWHEQGLLYGLQSPLPSDGTGFDPGDLGIDFPQPYLDLMRCTDGFVLSNAVINDPWHARERVDEAGVTVRLAIRSDRVMLEIDEARRLLLVDEKPVASTRELDFDEFTRILEDFAAVNQQPPPGEYAGLSDAL